MTPNIAVLREWLETLPEWQYVDRVGTTNCRPIAGSQTYSQHSWSNALDIHFTPSFSEAAVGPAKEAGDRMVAKIVEAFGDDVYELIWQDDGHWDHIHVSLWPKGWLTPPCAGGIQRIKYEDGTVANAPFPLTVEEPMAIPAEDLTEQDVNTAKAWEEMFTQAGVATISSTKNLMLKLIQIAKNYPVTPAAGAELPDEEIVKIVRGV